MKEVEQIILKLLKPNTSLAEDFLRNTKAIVENAQINAIASKYGNAQIAIDSLEGLKIAINDKYFFDKDFEYTNRVSDSIRVRYNVEMIDYILRNEIYSPLHFFNHISQSDIDESAILTYQDRLCWSWMSSNSIIKWQVQMVEQLVHKLDWERFSRSSFFAIESNIEKFQSHVSWRELSGNTHFKAHRNEMRLVNLYLQKWFLPEVLRNSSIYGTIELMMRAISENEYYFPESYYLIKKDSNNCWALLSKYVRCWSEEIFVRYLPNWHFKSLINNFDFLQKIVMPNLNAITIDTIAQQHNEYKPIDDGNANLVGRARLNMSLNRDFVLTKGRYAGKSIQEAIDLDLEYILWSLIHGETFCISHDLFVEIGNELIYKPDTNIKLVLMYESAKRSKARLNLPYCIDESDARRHCERMERKVEKGFIRDANEQFYNEFGADFNEDML